MSTKDRITALIRDIEDLREIVTRFKQHAQIPKIELDLALSRLRELYEMILKLEEQPVIKPESVKEYDPSPAKKQTDTSIPSEDSTLELIEETDREQVSEDLVGESVKEQNQITEKNKTDKVEPKQPKSETIADKYQGETKYIHDRLAQKAHKENISSKIKSQSILSIASSIGVNDKFQLIRNLFNGDEKIYNLTIKTLDSATNFNEAFNYLSTNFNWEMEDESVQFILDLVRRKFIVDKNE